MNKASYLQSVQFNNDRPAVSVMLESDFTKEVRIAFRKDQIMKEHKTAHPIVVQIIEGEIDFGVEGSVHTLERGDIISLEGNVPHNLKANLDSIVRLTLLKADSTQRVEILVNQ